MNNERIQRQLYLREKLQHKYIPLLDKGWLTLDDWMKDDFDIVRHARESTTADLKGEDKDLKLLEYLIKNGHVSPFEMPVICFRAYMPIFNFRQWVRHKSLHVNELSGRYVKEMPDDVFIPDQWRIQDTQNKQSSLFPDENNATINTNAFSVYKDNIYNSKATEKHLRELGIANELARLPNTVSQYTRVSISGTLRDWLWGFLRQRLHTHAQLELRVYAYAVAAFISELYPETWKFFMQYVIGDLGITLHDLEVKSSGDEYVKDLLNNTDMLFEKVKEKQLYIKTINDNINKLAFWRTNGS